MNQPILSIITVCFNAENTIKRTIESIYSQTFTNFEYIIIDGNSSDNTYSIVCAYDELFAQKKIIYRHISEPDRGIYNAMNKAVMMAKGTWLAFMNADDNYASSDVLSKVFDSSSHLDADIIYGDVSLIKDSQRVLEKARSIDDITKWMVFSHQSAFIKSDIQKQYGFNEEYKVSADYDMLLRCYLDKRSFKYLSFTVADFSCDGLTGNLKNKYKTYLETLRIQEDNGIINQKSMKIRLRKIFHYLRLKTKEDSIAGKAFRLIVQAYQRIQKR